LQAAQVVVMSLAAVVVLVDTNQEQDFQQLAELVTQSPLVAVAPQALQAQIQMAEQVPIQYFQQSPAQAVVVVVKTPQSVFQAVQVAVALVQQVERHHLQDKVTQVEMVTARQITTQAVVAEHRLLVETLFPMHQMLALVELEHHHQSTELQQLAQVVAVVVLMVILDN
jgi:hypothetical protein